MTPSADKLLVEKVIIGKSVSFSGHFSKPKKISKEERFFR